MQHYANESWSEGSYHWAAKGLQPIRYSIPTGTVLYRFINQNKGPAAADGPWWFEFEHYRAITSFAQRHGYSTGYAARLFAAILHEWSDVTAVVRATVVHGPLMAWKGPGKQVTAEKSHPGDVSVPHGLLTERRGATGQPPESRKMTPMQGPLQVLQLYIPGLGPPHHQFGSLMRVLSVQRIEHHPPPA